MRKMFLWLFLFPLVFASHVPAPQGFVNDFAGVIDSFWEEKLTEAAQEMKDSGVAEVAIVTIPSLEGYAIEEFGLKVGEEWKVGKKGVDNGLVLLIAPNEKKYRFEVGYGLEGNLNDAKVGRIGRNVLVPFFQKKQYGEGIYKAVLEVRSILGNETVAQEVYRDDSVFEYFELFFFAYFFVCSVVLSMTDGFKRKFWKRLPVFVGLLILVYVFNLLFFVFAIFITFFMWAFWSGKGLSRGGRFGGGLSGGSFSGGSSFGGGGFGGGGSSGGW